MVLGYFAYESTVLGYGLAAAASIPGTPVSCVSATSFEAHSRSRTVPYASAVVWMVMPAIAIEYPL